MIITLLVVYRFIPSLMTLTLFKSHWGVNINSSCKLTVVVFRFTSIGLKVVWLLHALNMWASALCIRFTIIPPRLTDQRNFITVLMSNTGTRADNAFVLKRGVWRYTTWPSHSRPAIATSVRHFQICFSPLTIWPLVYLPTLCLPSPFYATSHE